MPGIEDIARLVDEETRSISPENPTGGRGTGALAVPDARSPASALGKGWKARPFIEIPAGASAELARIEGPGTIRHIWLTADPKTYRACVLRIYWNEEAAPSVEVPLGDFFANGHGVRCNVNSIPISVNPSGGFNSYWPMPFSRHCRITIENQLPDPSGPLYYQVSYSLGPVDQSCAYFHAQWRRSMTTRELPEHTILDGVTGRGHYVGTYLAWSQLSDGWWGEGEVKFYLDDDVDSPTICGTGTEDYFGGAWCFGSTYSGPFLGYPLFLTEKGVFPLLNVETGSVPKHGLYRWHIPDPVRFRHELRVTVQALGWWPGWKFQPLTDDIASVAYWYQTEPHVEFPHLPGLEARHPR